MIERLRIWYRTFNYSLRKDPGGMKYLHDRIEKGDVVFDIGAHKGGYLNKIRNLVGKEGLVVGFEPQSVLFEYLKDISETLSWKNVIIENMGISDKPGTANLYVPTNKIEQESSPGATILGTKPDSEISKIESIELESLDNYIERTGRRPSLLKIDVEGNELNVFRGGVAYIRAKHPKILVEIEARHIGIEKLDTTFSFLTDLGYKGYFIHHKDFIELDLFSFHKYQNLNDMDNYCNNFIFE